MEPTATGASGHASNARVNPRPGTPSPSIISSSSRMAAIAPQETLWWPVDDAITSAPHRSTHGAVGLGCRELDVAPSVRCLALPWGFQGSDIKVLEMREVLTNLLSKVFKEVLVAKLQHASHHRLMDGEVAGLAVTDF